MGLAISKQLIKTDLAMQPLQLASTNPGESSGVYAKVGCSFMHSKMNIYRVMLVLTLILCPTLFYKT